ncbi:MAG: penicillin-binding transpeptidase domain-containing protein [Solirubrobacterales bacterium]
MSRLPPAVERRRRLVTRTLPLAIVAIVSFVVGAAVGAPGSPEKDSAQRFVESWAVDDYAGMYEELNGESQEQVSRRQFANAYRQAETTATMRSLRPGTVGDAFSAEGGTRVPVPTAVKTVAFGPLEEEMVLPFSGGGIAWSANLVFPGLGPGERLESEIELAPRAPILARDGTPLAQGSAAGREHPLGNAALNVTGEVGEASEEDLAALRRRGIDAETMVGLSGLERALNARLMGKPGGKLLAVGEGDGEPRVLAESEPEEGTPVKTTIDVDLQEAAVAALAGRAGGIAALDSRNGDVRALAGQAFSAPQPPGSTFKIVTTAAALQKGILSLDDEYEIVDGINVGGRFISNANGEFCGGTFRHAFAESCNSVFAPLGPQVGNDDLVATAERFGFNSPPTLYASRLVEAMKPAESTIPTEIPTAIELGVSAIGQGEVQATPLQMASVAQTVANGGVREPTSIVSNRALRPDAEPVRVMSRRLAKQLTELMVGVVVEGTGTAGAIVEAQVAGKTGTAELGPKPGSEDEEEPEQIKDAWFTAFAPAGNPRLAVGVLLIEAEAAGGDVAAPAAAQVLSAGL